MTKSLPFKNSFGGPSTVEYTRVNGLNREVSRIGLGTWSIGGLMWGGTDEQEALQTIRAACRHSFPRS
jgi:aryl-alcohol dehydrogenase-like predicted oxidoreductase